VSILVLDHDEPTREMIAHVLGDLAYEVIAARSVTPEDIRALLPDLILLELEPHRYGHVLRLVETIRTSPVISPIPVIITSTDAQQLGDLARELGDFGCSVLDKPFELDDLIACVERALHPSGEE
jgi:CheY-like chemotaxis protein